MLLRILIFVCNIYTIISIYMQDCSLSKGIFIFIEHALWLVEENFVGP
jgi:hypothetical protein